GLGHCRRLRASLRGGGGPRLPSCTEGISRFLRRRLKLGRSPREGAPARPPLSRASPPPRRSARLRRRRDGRDPFFLNPHESPNPLSAAPSLVVPRRLRCSVSPGGQALRRCRQAHRRGGGFD